METRKGNNGPIAQLFQSSTVDSASVTNGQNLETSVAFPGALVGDTVVASPRTALINGIALNYLRVSAADTVQLCLLNYTAAPIDPASNVYDIVLNRP